MSAYSFSIKTDVGRNVMYIEQHGQPSAGDVLDLKEVFVVEVGKLRPGFSIVNDQRDMNLEPYDEDAMVAAKELIEITNRHGASRVIRILSADFLSTVTLGSMLAEGRSQYASIRVGTPEEAEEALEELAGNPIPDPE